MSKNQVRPTSKGQVTLPVKIRRQLNVNTDTLLEVTVDRGKIILQPLQTVKSSIGNRVYSTSEIARFLKEDKISTEDATFFSRLLG